MPSSSACRNRPAATTLPHSLADPGPAEPRASANAEKANRRHVVCPRSLRYPASCQQLVGQIVLAMFRRTLGLVLRDRHWIGHTRTKGHRVANGH